MVLRNTWTADRTFDHERLAAVPVPLLPCGRSVEGASPHHLGPRALRAPIAEGTAMSNFLHSSGI